MVCTSARSGYIINLVGRVIVFRKEGGFGLVHVFIV